MRKVTDQEGMILISQDELDAIRRREYERGYAEGMSASASPTRPRSRAKLNHSGDAVEFRSTVADKVDG